MSFDFYTALFNDVRMHEGLNACMNCGICTAICPAAEFYEYDPRSIATTVQSRDKEKIQQLLESDLIWFCGQCMSCKTRCPRGNCPGLIISVLRKVSQQSGLFINSKKGRQQYLIMNTIGKNLLTYGYCIHPAEVLPQQHPEQGPAWKWVHENRDDVYASLHANLDQPGAGILRKIPTESMNELLAIFDHTGCSSLFADIERYSRQKARELGLTDANGQPDMDQYSTYLLSE